MIVAVSSVVDQNNGGRGFRRLSDALQTNAAARGGWNKKHPKK